jgi:uncharacterized protein (TIGR02996 family)
MTNTEQALLAAVIAAPEDDLPRLAYADLCEEHDDYARAEFIRAQVEVSRLGGLARDCDRRDDIGLGWALPPRERADLERLWTLAGDLLRANAAAWTPDPFAALDGLVFRRGFVAEVTLPCDAWVAHGPGLVRAAPLERVTLGGKVPYSPAWEALPPGSHPCWWWVCASRHNANRPEALPRPLFRALARLRRKERRTGTGLGFADRDLALLALSQAALCWARAAAVAAPPGAGV